MPEVYSAPISEVKPEEKKETTGNGVEPHKPYSKEEVKTLIHNVLGRMGEGRRKAAWGAYWVYPQKKFVSEQEDEEVVLLLRAHPVTNLGWIMLVAIMLMIPGLLEMTGMLSELAYEYVFVGKLAWYLITLGLAFEKFLKWYFTVFIVTNERLVDIDFVNLMFRVVNYANLNHIEEPSMSSGGIMRSIFRYGDVVVATAAEKGGVEALAVPYPEKVIRLISELSEELEKRRESGR